MKTYNIESPSTNYQHMDEPHAQGADSTWRPLYRVGGAVALITVVFIVTAIIVFIIWPPPGGLAPIPSAVIGCFTLLQKNKLLGLLDIDLLLIASYVLSGLITLALYVALRRTSQSFMAIALMFGLVGVAVFFASNPTFGMLSLSDQYAAATTDAQRSTIVAAGQTMLAIYQGTAFDVSYLMGAISSLIIAVVMLRSNVFSKVTAYVGLLVGIMMLVPPTVGTIGVILSLISLLPTMIWYILIARRLFQL